MTQLSNQPFHWSGPPDQSHAVLLLHGLGGGVYEMQPIGQHLHALGYTVKAINYPGHDQPAQRMPASTWPEWSEAVQTAYEELSQQHAQISVVGFSTGCLLALQLAHEAAVNRLVLLSPFLKIRHHWAYGVQPETYIRRLGHLIPSIPRLGLPINDPHMRRLAEESAYFQNFNIQSVQSALALIEDVKPRLSAIQAPTLILHSKADQVICPSSAQLLKEQLGSPEKYLHWLEKSNHILPLDVEQTELLERIQTFLREPGA